MSTLFIQLPARHDYAATPLAELPACAFALLTAGKVVRDGCTALPNLAKDIAAAEQVVLLLAASDVTLLQLPVPPMAMSKLQAALPYLVEEYVLDEPAACVIVAAANAGGREQSIALVQRDWLVRLSQAFAAWGARSVQAIPAQLCLPYQDGVVALIGESTITVRTTAQQGLGWQCAMSAPAEVLQHLQQVVVASTALTVYVPALQLRGYQAAAGEGIVIQAASAMPHWAEAAAAAVRGGVVNLLVGLGGKQGGARAAQPRWPWVLAILLVVFNLLGLNLDWWHMANEASQLRSGMLSSYRAAFPGDTVIVDPLAQTKQKLAQVNQFAADDFVALSSHFGAAWATLDGADKGDIESLDYHDHQLWVHLKNPAAAQTYRAQMQAALARNHLVLGEAENGVWKIGSHQ